MIGDCFAVSKRAA